MISPSTPTSIDDVAVVMTQQEVADLLRVDVSTIKRWRKSRADFPEAIAMSYRVILFRKDEIFAWIETMKEKKKDLYEEVDA